MTLPVGSTIAGYRIERLIGTGHMGAVYLARSPELERSEALKVLNLDLLADDSFRSRFLREANVAAQLSHPSIVPVYRRGSTDDGLLWIAMLYVDGTDADAAVQLGCIGPRRALHIGTEVAKALDYAHARGVVHRDVKPANFLLSDRLSVSPTPEHVFLGDFGLAQWIGRQVQHMNRGAVLATVGYVAPEILAGGDVDARADLYSLGCSLVRMLTGRRPFTGSVDEVIEAHLCGPAPRVSELCDVPAAMDAVIAKAMAKDPARRFDSARELMAAATEALERRGRQVPPPRPVRRGSNAARGFPSRPLFPSAVQGQMWKARDGNLADFAPPARAPRGSAVRLQARAAAARCRGVGRGLRSWRGSAAAALLVAAVVGAVWWSGWSSDEGERTVVGSPMSTVSSIPAVPTKAETTSPTANVDAQVRLLADVMPGFPPDVCQPVAVTGAASAAVRCATTGDPVALGTVTYESLPDQSALTSGIDELIRSATVAPCPGNIQSPGPWRRNSAPEQVAGTLVCGQQNDKPLVAWTTEGKLLLTTVEAVDGTTLDQLFAWWATHS